MAKILLVEDEALARCATRRVLEQAGHLVASCEDGRQALAHLERDGPDLLITDIFMPEMDGLETIRRAGALRPGLPIVAMSGPSPDLGDYLGVAISFGALAGLRKPFRAAELLDVVARVLGSDPGWSCKTAPP